MAETIDEQESQGADVQRYLDVLRRRQLQLLIPFFLTWLMVWGVSWVLPPYYKSTTQILVEQPTMPENYVAPNVNDSLQARLQSITQQILSSTRLLTIINNLHLYPVGKDISSADDQVRKMRKDISIDLVRDPRNNEITAFKVSYSARDPHVAQKVTEALKDLFINENVRVREQESRGTTNFLQDQLETARVELEQQEAKVKAFEATHQGILPSQQQSNLQILAGFQAQLQNEQDTLNQARQQGVYLQAMIEQNRAARGGLRADGTPTGLAQIDEQLSKMRSELVDLRSRYTDEYPDVIKLKEQIGKMEKVREEIASAPIPASDETPKNRPALEPNAPLAQLQGQLKANQLEVINREHRITELQQRINEYQGRLNAAPGTEQEYAEVTRGYDQSKAIYDDLLKKKNASAMATSMEQLQEGQHFTVLDPPSLPVKPDFPNRLKFCGIGIALGLVLGALIAGGFEFADDRLHQEADLKALLPTQILTEIPEVVFPSDQHRARRKLLWSWAVTAAALVIIAAGATISFLFG